MSDFMFLPPEVDIERWLNDDARAGGKLPSKPAVCGHCGGTVTLYQSGWPTNRAFDHETGELGPVLKPAEPTTWTCPHCRKPNTDGFAGWLTFASIADTA